MKNFVIEEIREEHLQSVLEIYNYYVLNTTATFHIRTLTISEMKEIVCFVNPVYKTFIIKNHEEVCGYVILTQHKKREAYDKTAEISIYLKQEFRGQGLGNLAIQHIEDYARTVKMRVLIATVCGENTRSIQLFSKNGYEKCAHYKEVGSKFGRYLDLVAYQKILY